MHFKRTLLAFVVIGQVAMIGVIAICGAPLRADEGPGGTGQAPNRLALAVNGPVTVTFEDHRPFDCSAVGFPGVISSRARITAPVRSVSNDGLRGTATVITLCRGNPGGNLLQLINVSDTVFQFEDGRTIITHVTTFAAVVTADVLPNAADGNPQVDLAVVGRGVVTENSGTPAATGGTVVQSGSVIEELIPPTTTLGARLLPVEAHDLTYLIDTQE